MNNQELSAMIAEEVGKAVAPLYEKMDQMINHRGEEIRQEPEETPDFTSTAKRLREKGLIK